MHPLETKKLKLLSVNNGQLLDLKNKAETFVYKEVKDFNQTLRIFGLCGAGFFSKHHKRISFSFRDWLILAWVGEWVMGRALWVVGCASLVVRRACMIAHSHSRRLLLVEFKDPIFLYMTLCIHEKVSPIKFHKANLSAKYILPGPLPFSCMLLAHSWVLNEKHMRPRNHFWLKENSEIIAAFISPSMSEKTFQYVC